MNDFATRHDDIVMVGAEATPMPQAPLSPPHRSWNAHDVVIDECFVRLDSATREEALEVVEHTRRHPLPVFLRTPSQVKLPKLRAAMERVGSILDRGIGVAVLDKLPVDEMSLDEAKTLYWILGQLLAPPVSQQWRGVMLYDVTDTGEKFEYGVRGSYTNVELVFHTDNAFSARLPQYVGLLCLHPAAEGGTSRFANVVAVHDLMLENHPRLLARLYAPMLWDRQAEHAPGSQRISCAPMFRYEAQQLTVRFNQSLVRKGYALANQPIDSELDDALCAINSIVDNPAQWFECPIERGQLQYLNNFETVHYRSEFFDPPTAINRRHLVRMWHRTDGDASYDG